MEVPVLLDAALDKEEHIKRYQGKYYDALVDEYLAPQDWQNLRETRNFLQLFWKKIFPVVKKLWKGEYKNLLTVCTTPFVVPALELDGYDLLAKELNVIGTDPGVAEYETYTSQPPIPIDCSRLVWWLHDEQKERFSRLSKIAINILSIPVMSADPERTFSGLRRTISWDRMLFGASTIEKGECLESWIRSGRTAGLQVDEVEQYEYMAEEGSTSALEEDVGH
ncbi:hypothetical protein FOCG_08532 [Fusarium oxysporum f. sp. radicis-lycopersici 26381]|nr:hypothetical protein FOCG_08532 [Fusarium oxysporum f. sp. radicis-lycopersici 26381]